MKARQEPASDRRPAPSPITVFSFAVCVAASGILALSSGKWTSALALFSIGLNFVARAAWKGSSDAWVRAAASTSVAMCAGLLAAALVTAPTGSIEDS